RTRCGARWVASRSGFSPTDPAASSARRGLGRRRPQPESVQHPAGGVRLVIPAHAEGHLDPQLRAYLRLGDRHRTRVAAVAAVAASRAGVGVCLGPVGQRLGAAAAAPARDEGIVDDAQFLDDAQPRLLADDDLALLQPLLLVPVDDADEVALTDLMGGLH